MDIKPIKTEGDYDAALKEVERLMEIDIEPDTAEEDRLEVLVALVEAYEAKQHAIGWPGPIEAIKIRMEDLARIIHELLCCNRPLQAISGRTRDEHS